MPNRDDARRTWRKWVGVAAITTLLSVGAAFYRLAAKPATKYITSEVVTGSLTVTVTAAGHLEPRNQVELGTEISGTVQRVCVNVNDLVRAGQVLAVLDTSRLQAQLSQAKSALASAEARVLQSGARVQEATANHARLIKLRELSANRLPAQQAFDFAEAKLERSRAEAAAARAAVAQARAHQQTIEADLSKAEIRSPINGVVLVRSVESGQTVAASLQAPVLFTLAEDLRQMGLHVAVDEADVGTVQVGQSATLTVDAFPDRSFEARITRIHLASNNTRNSAAAQTAPPATLQPAEVAGVVTYETVLEVANPELLLRPGMSATAQIVTGRIGAAILVPNAAMRFTPPEAQFPKMKNEDDRGRGMIALLPHLAERWRCPREGGQALGCVWILERGEPVLAMFKPGATDRFMTQVIELERLPNWSSVARQRRDPVFTRALERSPSPGTKVIVGSKTS